MFNFLKRLHLLCYCSLLLLLSFDVSMSLSDSLTDFTSCLDNHKIKNFTTFPYKEHDESNAPTTIARVDSETTSGLGARNIGSAAMSGRVAAVAAVHEGDRLTIYVGSASGGVWKSMNGGTTFEP